MKKSEQRAINKKVEYELAHYNEITDFGELKKVGRLRQCQAYVYETAFYYVLRSYRTVVAVISKRNMALYDFSRFVYGYTAITSQHIAKFANEYDISPSDRYTWKEVK